MGPRFCFWPGAGRQVVLGSGGMWGPWCKLARTVDRSQGESRPEGPVLWPHRSLLAHASVGRQWEVGRNWSQRMRIFRGIMEIWPQRALSLGIPKKLLDSMAIMLQGPTEVEDKGSTVD